MPEPTPARPPLIRPKQPQPTSTGWQDAFYLIKTDDTQGINKPWYVPMSLGRTGPYSTHDAAVQAGIQNECAAFQVEKRYVNPGIRIEYLDRPTLLNEEWSDAKQFAEDTPKWLTDT